MRATLVRGRYVWASGERPLLADGAVAVAGTRIEAAGPFDDLRRRFPDAEVVGDGRGIVIPGLVNCHGHFSEGLMAGLTDTMTLLEWIDRLIVPAAGVLTREIARVGTVLRAAEMALSGVTTVNDMFVCAPGGEEPVTPGVVEGLEEVGLRGEVSFGAEDRSGHTLAAIRREHEALAEAAAGSRRCRFRLGVATMPGASDELLAASAEWMRREGWGLHVHLHEVREEVTASRLRFGETSIRAAMRFGLLDGPALAAHCIWVNDDDIATLTEHRTGVAHNPLANMILGSGVCPVGRLREAGIAVGVGTDGAASNDAQDMLEVLKATSLLQKVHRLDPSVVTAEDVLRMGTIDGARALGLADRVGSLEPGKEADLVLLSTDTPALATAHDPVRGLVHAATAREVRDVWVQGERIVSNGRLTRLDLEDVYRRARTLAAELARRAGFQPFSTLAGEG